jgi:hypothetical protein
MQVERDLVHHFPSRSVALGTRADDSVGCVNGWMNAWHRDTRAALERSADLGSKLAKLWARVRITNSAVVGTCLVGYRGTRPLVSHFREFMHSFQCFPQNSASLAIELRSQRSKDVSERRLPSSIGLKDHAPRSDSSQNM